MGQATQPIHDISIAFRLFLSRGQIKRRPNLSVEEGGSVGRVGKHGQSIHLGTYCRLFQTKPPHHRLMLCCGYSVYPPCPDYSACALRRTKQLDVLPEELLQAE